MRHITASLLVCRDTIECLSTDPVVLGSSLATRLIRYALLVLFFSLEIGKAVFQDYAINSYTDITYS